MYTRISGSQVALRGGIQYSYCSCRTSLIDTSRDQQQIVNYLTKFLNSRGHSFVLVGTLICQLARFFFQNLHYFKIPEIAKIWLKLKISKIKLQIRSCKIKHSSCACVAVARLSDNCHCDIHCFKIPPNAVPVDSARHNRLTWWSAYLDLCRIILFSHSAGRKFVQLFFHLTDQLIEL